MINSTLLKERSYIFKGRVVSNANNDPLNLNRVQIWVPQIHGGEEPDDSKCGREGSYPWASCIVMNNMLPTVGAIVAVGFEGNDYNNPIIFGIYSSDTAHLTTINGQGGVDDSYAGGTLAEIAAKIIFSNEGSYTSVAWNDNGAISIGKIQWHANRARNLLRRIREANATKFDETCNKYGASELISLLSDSVSWANMKNWSDGCPIGKAIKEILGTDESKKVQDDQAIEDVQGYLDSAKKGGITDPACLIYLADIINQYGSAPSLVNSGINNLDELHNFALSNGYGTYKTRRVNTYNAIKKVESEGGLTPSQLSDISGGNTGGMLLWPAPGISGISSKWGWRGAISGTSHSGTNWHNGIDILAPTGTKIIAVDSGTVSVARFNDGGYGWYVVIKHPQHNLRSLYAHGSSRPPVSEGQQVSAGQQVLISGNTGNSSGPHLHFTIATGLEDGTINMGSSRTGQQNDKNPLDYVKAP